MEYQYFVQTQGHPSKPNNGDHAGYVHHPDNDRLWLVVSDGVSSSSQDFAASGAACSSALEYFAAKSGRSPDERLGQALLVANESVIGLAPPAAGSMATLILAECDTSTGECRFVSVGDSRVFKVGANQPECLTEDDTKFIVIRRAGQLVLQDGAVVSRKALTQALGQGPALQYQLQSTKLAPGELLVLTTDGCYEMPEFLARLGTVQCQAKLEDAAQSLLMDYHREQGDDDGSVAMIRRVDYPEEMIADILRNILGGSPPSNMDLPGHLILGALMRDMCRWAEEPDIPRLTLALDFIQREGLNPGRNAALACLEAIRDDRQPETMRFHRRLLDWAARL